eukprot:TRINITY_DN16217_c0_g2_i1.p1 TRINITY_DN16217_c0_g2~~TRINITY_DN16217_c0_g2_i1.p1  ORF type:complete len:481 (-),score=48.12 TRINITY_DN16217_c0_g2_i1:63-1505(-)
MLDVSSGPAPADIEEAHSDGADNPTELSRGGTVESATKVSPQEQEAVALIEEKLNDTQAFCKLGGIPACVVAQSALEETIVLTGISEDEAAAQCMHWGEVGLIIVMFQQLFIYSLTRYSSTCVDGSVKMALWVWLALVPLLACRAYAELRIVQWMLLVVLHRNNDLRIGGIQTSVVVWLIVYGVFSLLNTLDIGTDSMFAAVTSSTVSCGKGDTLKQLWRSTWAQSVFAHFSIPAPDIDVIVMSAWLLSFVQLLWPAVTSLERRYVTAFSSAGYERNYQSSLMGKNVFFADVVWDLGDASGMATISKFQLEKEKQQVKTSVENAIENWGYVDGLVDAMPKRVFLTWLAENALQINLQTTMFALTKAAAARDGSMYAMSSQMQALASISISILATLVKLLEAREWLLLVSPLVGAQRPQTSQSEMELVEAFQVRARRARWFVWFGCIALVGTLAYALAKLVGAFVCRDMLLNITGCVVLGD